MVYFYELTSSETSRKYQLIVGENKFENDLLLKYGYRELNYVWFHADKYSSGHIYLKLFSDEKSLEDLPPEIIKACSQLCKSESIQGNKLNQCTIICTPWHNLRKSKDMKAGEVSFKSLKRCRRLECYARDQKLLNGLAKTRVKISDGLEELLHQAKKSKDGDFFLRYLTQNRERLIEEEKIQKQARKNKKRAATEENNDQNH